MQMSKYMPHVVICSANYICNASYGSWKEMMWFSILLVYRYPRGYISETALGLKKLRYEGPF